MQQILKKCLQEFESDETSMLFYEAVRQTFEGCPGNSDKSFVLLKFIVLNNLYQTNVMARDKMVDHLHNLALKKGLDRLLISGKSEAVNKIRLGHGILVKKGPKERDFYSFAAKYCHFSNPRCYPVYDRYVSIAVMNLRESNHIEFHNQDDFYEPKMFRDIIDQIIERFGFADYQEADRALWVYGQYLEGKWPVE
jgi:hypothetical protein